MGVDGRRRERFVEVMIVFETEEPQDFLLLIIMYCIRSCCRSLSLESSVAKTGIFRRVLGHEHDVGLVIGRRD